MRDKPTGAGNSTFDMIDAERLFSELSLSPGQALLDVGCGTGEYALAASTYVTETGVVHAVDLWEQGVEALTSEAEKQEIDHIRPKVADVGEHIPLEDDSIDVTLMAAVLHDLLRDGKQDRALREVRRVLRSDGIVAVVEFKKIAGSPGPPVHVRLSPQEVEELMHPHRFETNRTVEVGPYHYASLFRLEGWGSR